MPDFGFGGGGFGGNSFGGGSTGYGGGSSGGGGSSSWSQSLSPGGSGYSSSSGYYGGGWKPVEDIKNKWKKLMGNFQGTRSASPLGSAHASGDQSFILDSLMKVVDMTSGVGYPSPDNNAAGIDTGYGGTYTDYGYALGSEKDEEVPSTLCYDMDGNELHCNQYGGECNTGQIITTAGGCI
jgi:hypothetical protein